MDLQEIYNQRQKKELFIQAEIELFEKKYLPKCLKLIGKKLSKGDILKIDPEKFQLESKFKYMFLFFKLKDFDEYRKLLVVPKLQILLHELKKIGLEVHLDGYVWSYWSISLPKNDTLFKLNYIIENETQT